MPHIENNGVKIYYETHGAGIPLVMLRGLSGTVDGWATYVDSFTDKYQLILIENRGSGKSDKPEEAYDVSLFAQDITLVLDELGIEQTAILGLSMSGFSALALYREHPERLNAIILGCTGPGMNDPQHVMFSKEVEEVLWSDRSENNLETTTRKYLNHFFHEDFRNANPELMEQVLQATLKNPQPAHAYVNQLEACYAAGPFTQTLETIEIPTLILHGNDDVVTPVGNVTHMVQHIRKAECFVHIFKGAGHMFFVEQKPKFIRSVRNFLDGVFE